MFIFFTLVATRVVEVFHTALMATGTLQHTLSLLCSCWSVACFCRKEQHRVTANWFSPGTSHEPLNVC